MAVLNSNSFSKIVRFRILQLWDRLFGHDGAVQQTSVQPGVNTLKVKIVLLSTDARGSWLENE